MAGRISETENQGKSDFAGKRVLVMGLGLHGGGAGAVEFFVRHGARVTVTDLRTRRELAPTLRALARFKDVRYVLGKHRAEDFRTADLIVKNPGVRRDSPYLHDALKRGIPVTSDIAIFFALCPGRIVGVTGTRGKSTTTYLIWKLLKTKFRRVHPHTQTAQSIECRLCGCKKKLKHCECSLGVGVYYGGNIRRSVLGILPAIKKDDLVVLELSSFQLMDLAVEKKSPSVAVLTNIMHDHLNWHRDMREYTQAKSVIFRYQKPGDNLFIASSEERNESLLSFHPSDDASKVQSRPDSSRDDVRVKRVPKPWGKPRGTFINGEDAGLRRLATHAPSRIHAVTVATLDRQKYSHILENVRILDIIDQNLGAHYRASVSLAVAVARHFGIVDTAIAKTLRGFKGLPARQEEIAMRGGVHFINDTTATIPDAAIAAIQRFRGRAGAGHKLILLAGGHDKKLDFDAMLREVKKSVDVLILLPGSATDRITKGLGIRDQGLEIKIRRVSSMEQAVRMAYKMAQRGDYIVLSPGAASFGLFLNEFDRGGQFVRAVEKLRQ